MKPEDLAAQCREKIERWKHPPFDKFTTPATITLVCPGLRLAGRSGPIGELICENEHDNLVAFECEKVLAWLKKNNLIT